MKTTRTLLILTILFFLIPGLALADNDDDDDDDDDDEKSAITQLQVQVDDLQNQINTIELTPGPQGATGEQGPAGADGTAGANGVDGAPGATGGTGPQGLPGIDGLNGVDAPDRTEALCELYQVLFDQSLIGVLNVPAFCDSTPPDGSGVTLTLSAPYSPIDGLVYDAGFTAFNNDPERPNRYTIAWSNGPLGRPEEDTQLLFMSYYFDSMPGVDLVVAEARPGNNVVIGTTPCTVGGTMAGLPACATDWGLAIDRAAGTLSFTDTPWRTGHGSITGTGTMNGSFTFPAF